MARSAPLKCRAMLTFRCRILKAATWKASSTELEAHRLYIYETPTRITYFDFGMSKAARGEEMGGYSLTCIYEGREVAVCGSALAKR